VIDGETMIFGVMGKDVRNSLSPLLHNSAFRALDINACYLAFSVDDIKAAIQAIRTLGIKGMSITIPFKEAVIPLLDGIDDDARRIGAVNTLFWKGSSLYGGNTDWLGAISAIEEKMEIGKRRFLVIGAGGAGKAIAFGLKQRGGEVILTNRSEERGKEVSHNLEVEWVPWGRKEEVIVDCIINATSIGMHGYGEGGEMPIDPDALRKGMTVMDIVTNPINTSWLKEANARGCITIDGSSMLLYQAGAQFEIWFGRKPPIESMRMAMKSYIEKNCPL
jgi:shikimate dehydrogenase